MASRKVPRGIRRMEGGGAAANDPSSSLFFSELTENLPDEIVVHLGTLLGLHNISSIGAVSRDAREVAKIMLNEWNGTLSLRGITDAALQAMLKVGTNPVTAGLLSGKSSISGFDLTGCKVSNATVCQLVATRPNLPPRSAVEEPACPLRVLRLAGCALIRTATIVKIAETCPKLKVLDISNCRRVDGAAASIALGAHCHNLRRINLNFCKFQELRTAKGQQNGGLQTLAANCSKLEHLHFNNCFTSPPDLDNWQTLVSRNPQLTAITLSSTAIAAEHVKAMAANCKNLKHLELQEMEDNILGLDVWGMLVTSNPGLTRVNVSHNDLTDDHMKVLAASCLMLVHIELANVNLDFRLTEAGIMALGDCPSLRHVNLSGRAAAVTDKALKHIIANCPLIAYLDLAECTNLTDDGFDLTEEGFESILPHLSHLDVTLCANLTEDTAWALSESKSLHYLKFEGCAFTDDAAEALAELPLLTHIDFTMCYHITNATAWELTRVKSLTHINFGGCYIFTDSAAVALAQLQSLTHIDFGGCYQFTDDAAVALAQLQSLTHINFERCYEFTDDAAVALGRLPSLSHINFNGCDKFTDKALDALASKSLRHANFSAGDLFREKSFTPAGVERFAANSPNLTSFEFNNHPRSATDAVVAEIAKCCKGLESVSFVTYAGNDEYVTRNAVYALVQHCPYITTVHLNDYDSDMHGVEWQAEFVLPPLTPRGGGADSSVDFEEGNQGGGAAEPRAPPLPPRSEPPAGGGSAGAGFVHVHV